jgi:hypothetical protein
MSAVGGGDGVIAEAQVLIRFANGSVTTIAVEKPGIEIERTGENSLTFTASGTALEQEYGRHYRTMGGWRFRD